MSENNEIYNSDVPKNTIKTAKRLFSHLKDQRLRLILVGICIVIYVFLTIYSPFYSALVIDKLIYNINYCIDFKIKFQIGLNNLNHDLFILCLMYFFQGVFYFLQGYLMASVAERLIYNLRIKISVKLNKLPLKFYDMNKPGEILSRVTNDLDKVSETLQTGLLKLITTILTLIGEISFMFYYSFVLTSIFLVFSFISLFITNYISKKNLKASIIRQEELEKFTGIVENIIMVEIL